jgi:hypothetical protein
MKFSFRTGKLFWGLFMLVLLVLLGELVLRAAFGFGDMVLVQEDPDMEYLAMPNQDRTIFGNQTVYNEVSMRSEKLDSAAIKILMLGDSVLNGGNLTDQKELASSILCEKLTNKYGKNIQVLNVSYKSWGPDNAFAYLEKYGDFGAKMLILVTSSHDAYDTMTFEPIVGKDVNYPAFQYSLAYSEMFFRYLKPRVQGILVKPTKGGARNGLEQLIFNPGFEDLKNYANEQKIPFIIYLHPEISEVNKGHYNRNGKLIKEFASANGIILVEGLKGAGEEHYRDNIHITPRGQQYLSSLLMPVIHSLLFK